MPRCDYTNLGGSSGYLPFLGNMLSGAFAGEEMFKVMSDKVGITCVLWMVSLYFSNTVDNL